MPYKNKEDQLAYQKEWRKKNRAKVNAYGQYHQAERRQRNKELINILKDVPCTDCGNRYPPYVMDFDHVKGNREHNIARMVGECSNVETILKEIAKCEVVCANCHRERTFSRK